MLTLKLKDSCEVKIHDGNKHWYQNSELHRDNGPAIEDANGDKAWYQNDKYHREDGPAVEDAEGTKYWYQNGELQVTSPER